MRRASRVGERARRGALIALCALVAGCDQAPVDDGADRQSRIKDAQEVVVVLGERSLTVAQLRRQPGLRWAQAWTVKPSPEALELHRRGLLAMAHKNRVGMATYLRRAAAAAPGWRPPLYDQACDHLLHGELEPARPLLAAVAQRSPRGFRRTRALLDALARFDRGELDRHAAGALVAMRWERNPVERERALGALLERYPGWGVGWLELARYQNGEARDRSLAQGLADAEADPDTRHCLRVLQAFVEGRKAGGHAAAVATLSKIALEGNPSWEAEQRARERLRILVASHQRY